MNGFLTEKATSSPSLESRGKTHQPALTSAHNASSTTSQFYQGHPADSDSPFHDPKGDPYQPVADKLQDSPISAHAAYLRSGQRMDLVNQSSVASWDGPRSVNNHTAALPVDEGGGAADDNWAASFGGRFSTTQQQQGGESPEGDQPHQTAFTRNVTDYISDQAMDTAGLSEGSDTLHQHTAVLPDAIQSSGGGGGGNYGAISHGSNNGTSTDTPFWDYVDLGNISFVGPLPTGLFPEEGGGGLDSGNYTLCGWNLTLCYNFSNTTEYPLGGGDTFNLTQGGGADGGSASMGPHRYWVLFLFIFPMLTVFGNVLVCLSVYRERSLRTITNYFIFSLAVADILVAVLVMPMAVYVEMMNGAWQLGDRLCDTWVALDVLGCTASILHLTAISIDRFIAVTRPIQYAKHKNSNRVFIMLIFVWLISLAISSPIALGMNYTERRSQTPEMCVFYNATFLIYSSMGSFYIPCIIMVILYWRIFKAIRERARRSKGSKAMYTNHNNYKNVIENKAQTRSSSSVSNIEENGNHSKQELSHVPSNTSSKPSLSPKPSNNVETSFTNYNAKFSGTDTDDAQLQQLPLDTEEEEDGGRREASSTNRGGQERQQQCYCQVEVVKSPTSDDTEIDQVPDNVIANQKLLLSPTSEEEPDGVKYDEDSSLQQPGYSAPSCVEVESTSKVLSPTYSNKALLSPLPHRKNFSMYKEYKPGKKKAPKHSQGGTGGGSGGGGTRKDNNQNSSPRKYVTKFNFHLRQSKKKKERSYTSRRERKATKTLAIVLGVFLLCWVPFFTLNIMNAICIRYQLFDRPECNLDDNYINFFVWLGYINSFLNPVIYTIFNVEFRKAFKKLLTCPSC